MKNRLNEKARFEIETAELSHEAFLLHGMNCILKGWTVIKLFDFLFYVPLKTLGHQYFGGGLLTGPFIAGNSLYAIRRLLIELSVPIIIIRVPFGGINAFLGTK